MILIKLVGRKSFSGMLNHCAQITVAQGHCARMANMLLIIRKKQASILNNQFSSVFTKDYGSILPNMGIHHYPDAPAIEFITSGIAKPLSELDLSKSSGPDD